MSEHPFCSELAEGDTICELCHADFLQSVAVNLNHLRLP